MASVDLVQNEQSAKESITRAKEAVSVEALKDAGTDSERLARLVNAVAEAEGRYVIAALASGISQDGGSKEVILVACLDYLAQGAQDTWSGRGNDARRAYADGLRAEVQSLRYRL